MREINERIIQESQIASNLLEQFHALESFLGDFCFLVLGRDNIACKNYAFSLQKILISSQATLGNIMGCCKCFCLVDAYTLLRKYRDDLFFCLYLVNYDVNIKARTTHSTSKMENNIDQWCKNIYCCIR